MPGSASNSAPNSAPAKPAAGLKKWPRPSGSSPLPADTFDYAIIGAGVFGAWTAFHLRAAGKRVALVDGYGPASNRASSGGETRIIRMGYGPKEIYTQWSVEALQAYQDFYRRVDPTLYVETGFLWMGRTENDPYLQANLAAFRKFQVAHEVLSRQELAKRFPQIGLAGEVTWGIYEQHAGGLLARRGVQTVVRKLVDEGLTFVPAHCELPAAKGPITSLKLSTGETLHARQFVFACGPWLPKHFPQLLAGRIRPTRQEIFYFGLAAGDPTFRPPQFPCWVDAGDTIYGLPDIENRGFKIAPDNHGRPVDPDTESRVVPESSVERVRAYLKRRFPKLANAPCVQAEVCQYENTINGDYLIDRHPEHENLLLVGGGSGHAYKHGPASGKYIANLLLQGNATNPIFSLETKLPYDPASRNSTIPGTGK